MIDKVILINSILGDEFSTGNQHLGLLTLQEGLKTAGFNEVTLLPSGQDAISDLHNLEKTIKDGQNTLFGITLMTECYSNFVSLSSQIRKQFPKSTIVGGGPHFQRELWNADKDPLDIALRQGLVDAVGLKHGKNLVELITEYNGDLASATKIPGLYVLGSGKVLGRGFGSYPKISKLPYITYEQPMAEGFIHVVQTVIDDSCPNFCDYCSINKSSIADKDMAINTLQEALREGGCLVLQDSNPFERTKLNFYREIFENLGNRKIMKTGFAHPGLFADKPYLPELTDFILENNFRKIFIGRECVTEDIAGIIGSRYNKKLKTQEQLDSEKEGIINFAKRLDDYNRVLESKGIASHHYELKVSYIVTPYGTKESYMRMSEEMEFFQNMSSTFVRVVPFYFILAPFPGTVLKRRLLNDIAHLESFAEHSFRANPWKDFLPGSQLLNELSRLESLYFTGGLNGMQHQLLKKAINTVYS